MHLKSFSAYGFKSFADRIELDFGSGITAIVGPNGSGKSNISDAVRWVLGEQSAKYLRGSKMEDVIFSGSSKRRALGVAEVTLNFDNSDHRLGLDFDEVSITRRVFRDGDSEYAINKKNCRLKDIIDLFADTGLGRGSLSIIGQNKIDEILNSRPEERRNLFEEAAGIVKYRLRKKDAARRLDDTAANLTRINDIKTEVESQLEPLKEAAAKTEQYNVLAGELRTCRLTQFVRKIDVLEHARAQQEEKDAALEREVAKNAAAAGRQQALCAQLQQEADALSENYNKLQDDIKARETALEKVRGQGAVLEERILQSRKAGVRLSQQNEKLEQQVASLEKQLVSLTDEYDVLEKKQTAAGLLVQKLTLGQKEKEVLVQKARQEADSLKDAAFDTMRRMVDLRNRIRTLETEQEQRMRRREALKKNIEETESELTKQDAAYRKLLENQADMENNVQLSQRSSAELARKLADENTALNAVRQKYNDCQRRITALESRQNVLNNMQKAYEGFGYGVKAVLRAVESWRGRVIGVAAELISVDAQYVTAIETALGAASQNIVMRDAEAAKAAIGYLKQHKYGRATFLPLDTIKTYPRKAEDNQLKKMPGVLGFADELISCGEDVEQVFKFLLGRVLVAQDMDAALEAARRSAFRMRVVTLQGDVVNAGGSLTGGSRQQKEAGFLSRVKEIETLAWQEEELRHELLGYQEQAEAAEEVIKEYSTKLSALKAELQKYAVRRAEITSGLSRAEAEKQRMSRNLEVLLDDRAAAAEEYLAARGKLQELRPQLAEIEKEDTESKSHLDALQKKMQAESSELESIRRQLQDARVESEATTAKTTMMAERMHQLDGEMERLQREVLANENEQQNLENSIAESENKKAELAQQTEALMAELNVISGGREEFTAKRIEIAARQEKAALELAQAQKALEEAEKKRNQAALESVKQNAEYEHVLQQLESDYGLTLEEAHKEVLLEAGDNSLRRQELSLQRRIEELGPVNAAAIEQYAAVKERFEFLQKQYDDLAGAKANLESVISEINSGMSKRFKEAFAKINVYFSECYVKLFGGGTAYLKLTDPGDVLSSGIDIEVQPPGKKLQSLYLLSGGERALTVIALLFALLSYSPAPFCILDEIDAALDEANVDRFARFLTAYAENTQFIVITHRKGTMEAAKVLHGVTMEESGVSKLLSVKLTEKE